METYISIDVEADGPIPGEFSMLSLGAAAFSLGNRTPLSTFGANLKTLPDASTHPSTMAWWDKNQEAWKEATTDPRDPEEVMKDFQRWMRGLPGKPVLVGYPITFDFSFVYWYYVRFVGFPAPFSFSALDLKTMAMVKMGTGFHTAAKRRMPKKWFEGAPAHTHRALDDAIGQGVLFVNMMLDKE